MMNEQAVSVALSPVISSQIAAVGYDASSRELVIKFHASSQCHQEPVYSYAGVPSELAKGLIAAESPGGFFHRHIRQGGFPYRRHQSGDLRTGDLACQGDANRGLGTHDTASGEGPP